jgi:hypothetical protein
VGSISIRFPNGTNQCRQYFSLSQTPPAGVENELPMRFWGLIKLLDRARNRCVNGPLIRLLPSAFGVFFCASAALAQMEHPQTDLMQRDVKLKTITVEDMINRGLWAIANEVFDGDAVARLGQAPPEVRPRGVEVLLFKPAFGAPLLPSGASTLQ